MEIQQSVDVMRIARDWESLYAPDNLIRDARTASLLVEWVIANEGMVSFSGLNHAVTALAAQVLYPDAPAPKVKSAQQIYEEGNAKMYKDFQDSLKPQPNFNDHREAETAKRKTADAVKAQAAAKGRLTTLIDSYECYKENGSGKDYPSTEMIKRDLRALPCGKDYVRAEKEMVQILQALPDHPRQNDVARVVEKLNAQSKQ